MNEHRERFEDRRLEGREAATEERESVVRRPARQRAKTHRDAALKAVDDHTEQLVEIAVQGARTSFWAGVRVGLSAGLFVALLVNTVWWLVS